MKALLAAALFGVVCQAQAPRLDAGRIRIEKKSPGQDSFNPGEIEVWAGDQIHWFNDTSEPHDPGIIRKDGSFVGFFDQPVAARSVSPVFSPLARVDDSKQQIAFTIQYVCGRHRQEQGSIRVVPTP